MRLAIPSAYAAIPCLFLVLLLGFILPFACTDFPKRFGTPPSPIVQHSMAAGGTWMNAFLGWPKHCLPKFQDHCPPPPPSLTKGLPKIPQTRSASSPELDPLPPSSTPSPLMWKSAQPYLPSMSSSLSCPHTLLLQDGLFKYTCPNYDVVVVRKQRTFSALLQMLREKYQISHVRLYRWRKVWLRAAPPPPPRHRMQTHNPRQPPTTLFTGPRHEAARRRGRP